MHGPLSGSADIYRASEFNDLALAVGVGPELLSGADRLSLEVGSFWRWFGGVSYSRANTMSANYFHPLGRKSQLRGTASVAFIDNRLNQLQDGQIYSASVSYERALSSRAGIGITLSANRQEFRDPGYSSSGGQATVFAYREVGPLTLVATASHERLKADKRLLLFPEPRSDHLYRASLAATFRNFRIGTFAPFAKATYERNRSTTEIYDFRRVRTEIGVTRAF